MDRTRIAALSFGVTFLFGYVLGRLFGDSGTGVRTGLALGAAGAVGSWRLTGREEPPDYDDDGGEPIEIQID